MEVLRKIGSLYYLPEMIPCEIYYHHEGKRNDVNREGYVTDRTLTGTASGRPMLIKTSPTAPTPIPTRTISSPPAREPTSWIAMGS
jgi:hypothetical protein